MSISSESIAGGLTAYNYKAKKDIVFYLGFICSIFWSVGTNFDYTPYIEPYWYIAHGVSMGELVFAFVLLLLLLDNIWRRRFQAALYKMKGFVQALLFLTIILLVSVGVNLFIYDGDIFDVLVCLKLIYFLLVAVFVHAYVKQYGLIAVILPFIIGMSFYALDQVYYGFSSPEAIMITSNFPMVRAPNVAGAIFGQAILLCSLAILHGGRNLYLIAMLFFIVASAFTFSKGAWLMSILGCMACLAALSLRYKSTVRSRKWTFLLTFLVATFLIYVVYDNYQTLNDMYQFKVQTTKDNATVDQRFDIALGGLYSMVENPLIGVGYRNYPVIAAIHPELRLEGAENAHNVFLQIGAVGGVIAFVLLIWLFIYPFKELSQVIPLRTWAGKIYIGAVFVVMFLFASVQLQLIAQPVFWVFIGLISGWKSIQKEYLAAEPHP